MNRFVLDSSAFLRYTDKEAGYDRVKQLIYAARYGRAELHMSAVNWGEVAYTVLHSKANSAPAILSAMRALPLQIEPADQDHAERAAHTKEHWKLAYADAFAAALAEKLGATLVTADYDFKAIKSGLKIEFLPLKP